MSWSRWPSVALAVVALGAAARAGVAEEVRRAVALGYDQQYDSAWQVIHRVPAADSLAPLVAFWRAALVQMLLYDSGDPALVDSFYRTSERAVEVCRARLRQCPDDAHAHMFEGLIRLNRANTLGWQRDYLRAFLALGSSSRSLSRAVGLDPGLHDAWFGMGAVEYFRSVADRYVGGIGIFGSRSKAHHYIARARAGPGWLGNARAFVLAYIQRDEGDPAAAVATCREVLAAHPGNRTGLKLLRDSHLSAGQYREALALVQVIDSSIRRDFPRNRYGLAENRLVAMKAWDGLARRDSALHCAGQIVAWERYERETPWLASYVAEARRYRRRWTR
ncbi:MAG: tetratricopeptide repeat protein [bacterium]